ncbi:MAG: hypothetical protein MUE96_00830 [Bacteroidia bacterium]|jgi:glutathione synthase/RimK-type ligase-like ATP-grasp enzyme|nr:hypothetical protein [Bacteroidia bacterium]
MIIKLLKRLTRVVVCIRRINWVAFAKLYQKDAQIVLWIHQPSLAYLGSDAFVKDFGILFGLLNQNQSFTIQFGNKIGRYSNKRIFYTLESTYNVFGFTNYVHVLEHISAQLEAQGNTLHPNSYESKFWENKAFMHEQFKKLGISEPLTQLFPINQVIDGTQFQYPLLVKGEHSCSSNGLYKIKSADEFNALINAPSFIHENKVVIVQSLIDMRKDLRVILVDNEIVLHYWRINNDKEWKPTSTSYGSDVDFDFFPEQWRQMIIDTFQKLNLTTGAFDITWQHDDLNSIPLILEVSPVYQPNPKMKLNGKPYAHYKKRFRLLHSWDTRYVDIVFEIKHKEVIACLQHGK